MTLGADVPFCIRGGLTRTTGIGEQMEDLPCGRHYPLVVIQPCEGLSTKEIFQAYHGDGVDCRPNNASAASALAEGNPRKLAGAMYNVMQPVSEKRRPAIAEAIETLKTHGAFAAQMTGSGSAVFGAFESAEQAENAYGILRAIWERTFLCTSCTESVIFEDENQN